MTEFLESPVMGWWRFTRLAIEALTRPKADVASCDRAMEQLAHDSWLGGLLHRASGVVLAGWLDSRARSTVVAVERELASGPAPRVFRLAGWMMAVAGATILCLNAIKPTPVGPLSWLVPSLVIVAGFLLMLTAAPVARASKVS
jgi:hypothetical protein